MQDKLSGQVPQKLPISKVVPGSPVSFITHTFAISMNLASKIYNIYLVYVTDLTHVCYSR